LTDLSKSGDRSRRPIREGACMEREASEVD